MNHKNRNFLKFMLLWAGELISAIGSGLTSFGLGVYVFRQTGSAADMALVTLLGFLPSFLLSIPAGVLADRYDRRLLMMIGDGCSALGILYIWICMMNGKAALYQICIGVFVSSVFSSLLEPSYRATVTDLLSKQEYSRASGMVSIAGSARYLVSPILAGALLAVKDIELLLLLDISTFVLTVAAAAVVRKGMERKKADVEVSFAESFRQGWTAITERRGVLILILVSSVITCFMGVLQILAEPLILDFSGSTTLGIGETVCACGMLVSGLYLGVKGIRKRYVKILCLSLFLAGLCMVGFGIRENMYLICTFGFLFFAMLPFANNCLDYLVRTNIPDELQGRVWGIIGFLSQIGYVVAYGGAGIAADRLAGRFDIGVGRGAAAVIMAAGVLLSLTSLLLYTVKSVKTLEGREI
ncbi:MFS transporter [Faecalicatena contorta]|uniref:MFS transporter n=1 Tax=Faecalicatena contorta TaxID=39482 RepID=UPI001F439477|nr:MFS transporter [Faecalicatena contorta]MCF2682815.1 MFS transporter [Faecalicatena contorta]